MQYWYSFLHNRLSGNHNSRSPCMARLYGPTLKSKSFRTEKGCPFRFDVESLVTVDLSAKNDSKEASTSIHCFIYLGSCSLESLTVLN